jgi:AcrR family transcriptional regulator
MSDSSNVTARPHRSTRQKQQTRARLIQAAMSVMAAKGADAATINDITEAADVGFGSFYNHFTSKEDVLEAATNELFDVIGGKIDEAIYAIADPCVALATAIRTFVGVLMLKKEWARFIIRISSPRGRPIGRHRFAICATALGRVPEQVSSRSWKWAHGPSDRDRCRDGGHQ